MEWPGGSHTNRLLAKISEPAVAAAELSPGSFLRTLLDSDNKLFDVGDDGDAADDCERTASVAR